MSKMLGRAPYVATTTLNEIWFDNLPAPTAADLASWNSVPGKPAQLTGTVVKVGLFGSDLSTLISGCYSAPSVPNSLCDIWSNYDGYALGVATTIDPT